MCPGSGSLLKYKIMCKTNVWRTVVRNVVQAAVFFLLLTLIHLISHSEDTWVETLVQTVLFLVGLRGLEWLERVYMRRN